MGCLWPSNPLNHPMFNIRPSKTKNPFENDLDDETPSNCSSARLQNPPSFVRVPILIALTVVVFVLLIAGTATTVISYPPKPPRWHPETAEVETALDGDYKLIGPLLLTSGMFLLVINVVLCAIVTRDAYVSSRSVRPSGADLFPRPGPVTVLGGPFYLATPSPAAGNALVPFAFSRQLWTMPNAPSPDFAVDVDASKGSKARAATAALVRSCQPPFNPDVKPEDAI